MDLVVKLRELYGCPNISKESNKLLSDAANEIVDLRRDLASQISASTKANHLRIKDLEEALDRAIDCIGEIGSEPEDYAVQEELRLVLVKGK